MIFNIIIILIVTVLLNYIIMYMVLTFTFDTLKEKDIDKFLNEVLKMNIYEYYNSIQVKTILPLCGAVFGLVFFYRFNQAKDKGYSDYNSLAEAYKGSF